MNKTIVAISTPSAPAGLGVLRLSGDQAIAVACRVFRPADPARRPDALPGYTAAFGRVFDSDGDIDECVALVFRAPHSYTGEDVVELSCHGGLYLLQRVLRACLAAGAVPAGPGEFTRRAFVAGKMDLTQAESVMDLIGASGRLAARTALAAREGGTYRRLEEVRASLLAVAAQFAAYVDYPDEDIPDLQPTALADTLTQAIAAMETLLATFDAGRVLREGVDTAIVGSPNVGKSTLMNALAGCQRSIVTAIAGTTRDVVEETVRLGEVTLRLADTAGIHTTQDQVESVGVERARRRLEEAALVLAVFDGSRPLDEDDRALARAAATTTAIAVVNKADCPLAADVAWLRQQFDRVVVLSARQEEGLQDLAAAVAAVTGVERLDDSQPVLATERQRLCAANCLDCLRGAMSALEAGVTLDAVTVEVAAAIDALQELTGQRATDTVVEQVFARFCVGK